MSEDSEPIEDYSSWIAKKANKRIQHHMPNVITFALISHLMLRKLKS